MIEEVKSYKYLRFTVNDNGLFNEHVSIKEKGNKAFYWLIAKSKEQLGF